MPTFDLRGIRIAKYKNTNGEITYENHTDVGDAMAVNLELRYAEGRLYAEGSLAEFIREAIGGSISIGVKYIPVPAQQMMYGAGTDVTTVGSAAVTGLKFTKNDSANYVGVGFYAPDMIDGVRKYTAVFLAKSLFGAPSMAFQTKNDTIVFQTPTTTGEFMPDDSEEGVLMIPAVCDSKEQAVNWIKAKMGEAG